MQDEPLSLATLLRYASTFAQVHSYSELLGAQADTYDFPVIDERSAAAMCYTSGTTGDPKGV
uniref:AMP-binding protein n=1 Tax=Nocardia barduliensis TaxID=2736643 RepID=UPI001FE92154